MRLRSAATIGLVGAAIVAGSISAAGDPPANFAVHIIGVAPEQPTPGVEFAMASQIVTVGLDENVPTPPGPRLVTYAIDLPSGLVIRPPGQVDFGPSFAPGGSTDCVRGCKVNLDDGPTGFGLLLYHRFLASAPGSYTVRLALTETNRPDPDLANNEFSFTVTVVAKETTSVSAGKLVASPTVPRAGRTFALTLPLKRAGTPVTPTTVRCTATLKAKSLKGAAARLAGKARCTWRITAGTTGAQLKAKVTAVAGGKTFTASRTARVR